MLTDEDDVVLDIFGGSNTTGFTAEALQRKWLTFELSRDYLVTSAFRFLEGHRTDTVRQVLAALDNDQANYLIEETVCSLDQAKKARAKNESIGQGGLFAGDAQYKANQLLAEIPL